jgi:hypothetical protein
MKKTILTKTELIYFEPDLKKYKTNVEGVYIYDVKFGWINTAQILKNQNKTNSDTFGQKSVIITYSELINNNFTGLILNIEYTRGLKCKYTLNEVLHPAFDSYQPDYYTLH